MAESFEVDVLRNWEDIEDLQEAWRRLHRSNDFSTFFLSWDWVEAWRRESVDHANPFVLIVRDQAGTIRGIAPFYLSEMRFLKLVPLRVLRILGDINSGAEYPNWLADPVNRDKITRALLDKLADTGSAWDLVWMPKIAPQHDKPIITACSASEMPFARRETLFSGMELPSSMNAFESGFSRNARSRMRRTTRNVQRISNVEFIRCESPSDLPEFLNALFELHDARWNSVGKEGLFTRAPAERRFYESFAPVALKNDWLRLYGLRCGTEFKAVQIGYRSGSTFLQMQEGFDPDFEAGCGNALRHLVIRDLIAEGVSYYDFLGGISEHKRRWGAKPAVGSDLLIGSRSVKSRFILSGPFWPTGRYLSH